MTEERRDGKQKRPWMQYLTLTMATLAMVFSLITAFHPFGLGDSSAGSNLPNFSQQNNQMGGGGFPGGPNSNNSTTNDSSTSSSTTDTSTT
jgi:hypothetical protein